MDSARASTTNTHLPHPILLLRSLRAENAQLKATAAATTQPDQPGTNSTLKSSRSSNDAWENTLEKARRRLADGKAFDWRLISEHRRRGDKGKNPKHGPSGTPNSGELTFKGVDLGSLLQGDPLDNREAVQDLGPYSVIDGMAHSILLAMELDMPPSFVKDRLQFLRWFIHSPFTWPSKTAFALELNSEYEGDFLLMEVLRTENRLSNEILEKHVAHRSPPPKPDKRKREGTENQNDPKGQGRGRGNGGRGRGNGSPNPKADKTHTPFVRSTNMCIGCTDPTFTCKGIGQCKYTHTCSKCKKNHALNWCDQ
jgi:hypothetical protein